MAVATPTIATIIIEDGRHAVKHIASSDHIHPCGHHCGRAWMRELTGVGPSMASGSHT